MADEAPEGGSESGSELRKKLEQSLEANKALTAKLVEVTVKDFRYVKPEDLAGIAPDQVAAKALEIEQARQEERQAILKEELESRGLSGDDLEAALSKQQKPAEPAEPQKQPSSPFASTGTLGGRPVADPPKQFSSGRDRIRAAMEG